MSSQKKKLKMFADNTPNPAHIQIIFEVENIEEEKIIEDKPESLDDMVSP